MEQWLDVADFPLYEVSSEGNIRNKKTKRLIKPLDNKNGGMMVILRRDGRGYSRLVRRLVANAFHPIGEEHEEAAPVHIDGDYRNCAADNLDWRPRWQARVRTMQLRKKTPIRNLPYRDANTGEMWANSLEAANAVDGIEAYLVRSAMVGYSYKGRRFEVVC